MEQDQKKQVVIPKEEAVFWMDENGTWHNVHGRFEHPRIIKYFNKSIKKDENGFYVHQESEAFEEKVYFPFKETAFFVVDIKPGDPWTLELNTGRKLALDPGALYSKDDSLYMRDGRDIIKFTSKAMLKLAKDIREENGELFLCKEDKMWPIK